jgi:hypothetical protein
MMSGIGGEAAVVRGLPRRPFMTDTVDKVPDRVTQNFPIPTLRGTAGFKRPLGRLLRKQGRISGVLVDTDFVVLNSDCEQF